MVAHRLNRRDGLVKRLAKALRFFDLHSANFGRVHDAGKLAQLARCVVFLTGKLLCDLVEAVDDPPCAARRNGGQAGVGKEVENPGGDVRGNAPKRDGAGKIVSGSWAERGDWKQCVSRTRHRWR